MIACSTCGKNKIIIKDVECGEIICSNCGMVISEKIKKLTDMMKLSTGQVLPIDLEQVFPLH